MRVIVPTLLLCGLPIGASQGQSRAEAETQDQLHAAIELMSAEDQKRLAERLREGWDFSNVPPPDTIPGPVPLPKPDDGPTKYTCKCDSHELCLHGLCVEYGSPKETQ